MHFDRLSIQRSMLKVVLGLMVILLVAACGAAPAPDTQSAASASVGDGDASETVEISWLSHIY